MEAEILEVPRRYERSDRYDDDSVLSSDVVGVRPDLNGIGAESARGSCAGGVVVDIVLESQSKYEPTTE